MYGRRILNLILMIVLAFPSVGGAATPPTPTSVPTPGPTSLPKSNASDFSDFDFRLYLHEKELLFIPKTPSQPPSLIPKVTPNYAHCERFFIYRGTKYECDSNQGRDADRLRPLLQAVPQALAELNTYQRNRQEVRISGYLMVIAGAIMGVGMVMSGGSPVNSISGSLTPGGAVALTGLTLGVGAIIHAFTTVLTNETHIEKAVHYYNTIYPNQPIDIKFKTGVGSELIQGEVVPGVVVP